MFIISKKYGRICNRLFNSAHVLASAIEHKHEFVNLAFYDYAHYFDATSHDIFCRYPKGVSFIKNHGWISKVIYYLAYALTAVLRWLNCIGIKLDKFKVIRSSEYRDGCNLDVVLLNKASTSNKLFFFKAFHF